MNTKTERERELEKRCFEMAHSAVSVRVMFEKGILSAAKALERGEKAKAELILRRLLTNKGAVS